MKVNQLIAIAAIGAIIGLGIGLLIKNRPTEKKKIMDEAIDNLQFAVGKSTISPDSLPYLDALADVLVLTKDRLSIVGHTDSSGSEAKNITLSQGRANAVKTYLVSKGVADTQIDAKGVGSAQPIADNTTPEGKEKNRRVELTFIK